jgi:hypothetical protein
METLKKPEMLIAVSSLFAVGGTYFYFYKKLGLVNERIDEFDKRLSSVIKKVGDNTRDTNAIGKNMAELNNYMQGINQMLKKLDLDFQDHIQVQNERYQNLVDAIEALGGTVYDSAPKRKPVRRYEDSRREERRGEERRGDDSRRGEERRVEERRGGEERRGEERREERRVDDREQRRGEERRSEERRVVPQEERRPEERRVVPQVDERDRRGEDRERRVVSEDRRQQPLDDRWGQEDRRRYDRKVKFEDPKPNQNLLELVNLDDKKDKHHSDSDSDDDFIEKTKN